MAIPKCITAGHLSHFTADIHILGAMDGTVGGNLYKCSSIIIQVTLYLGLSFALPSSIRFFVLQHSILSFFIPVKTYTWGQCGVL